MIIFLSITSVFFLVTTVSLGTACNAYKEAYKRLTDEHTQQIEINIWLREQLDKRNGTTN